MVFGVQLSPRTLQYVFATQLCHTTAGEANTDVRVIQVLLRPTPS